MPKPTYMRYKKSFRRGYALIGLVLLLPITGLAAAQESPLQKSYSTDPHLSCEGLQAESQRMDAIMAQSSTTPEVLRTAEERKKLIDDLLKNKTCDTAPKTNFGPDMYDRS